MARWKEVPVRKGEGAIKELRATPPDAAHPRSLSAIYGEGAQPLHTDGAHLRVPPDVVVLFSEASSTTPTLVWNNRVKLSKSTSLWGPLPESVRDGLFVVSGGADKFLAPAHENRTGWRYDPGCMTPADQRAREAMEHIDGLRESSFIHEWTDSDMILMIDNRVSLHARSAILAGDEDRVLKRVAFNTDGKS